MVNWEVEHDAVNPIAVLEIVRRWPDLYLCDMKKLFSLFWMLWIFGMAGMVYAQNERPPRKS